MATDPDSPQNIYAKNLRQSYGYPLRCPEPEPGLPVSYAESGLQIGDVGYVDEDGVFTVRFNICLPLDHDLHQTRRRDLSGLVDLTTFDPNEAHSFPNIFPFDRVICHGVRSSREAGGDNLKPIERFMPCSTSGAILILPSGALRQRLDKKEEEKFRKLAEEHAVSWCHRTECASLYLITGFYKTSSWHLASFHEARPTRQVLLERDNTGRYTWDPTCDRRESLHGNHNQNQTVLVLGFKIQVREWDNHVWVEKLPLHPSIWTSLTFLSSSLFHVLLHAWKWIVLILWDRVTFKDVNTGGVRVDRVPALSQPFHPGNVINDYLLQKNQIVQVAITHDSEWLSMLEKNEISHEDMVEREKFRAFLEERYIDDPNSINVVHLQRKSEPGVSDLCMRKLAPSSKIFSLPPACGDPNIRRFVITHMRVENSVTCLRRLPVGFYVLIQFNETKRRSKCKPASLSYGLLDSVIEWDDEITLPMDLTTEVVFSVHASFEYEPILGNGEILCAFKSSVGCLAQVGNAYFPWHTKETSSDASLLINLEKWQFDSFLYNKHPEDEECLSIKVVEETNKGHNSLLRFHDGQGTEDLEECSEHYNFALECCPLDHGYYAVAVCNFATARFINSRVHGASSGLDMVITSYRKVLNLRSHLHPDRPRILLFLAQALLCREMKMQHEASITDEIKKLAIEVRQICPESTYDYQAATLVLQTLNQISISRESPGLDNFISELNWSAKIRPWCLDRPYRLVNLSSALRKYFEISGDLACLENSISTMNEAMQLIPDGHYDKPWMMASLGDALRVRFMQCGVVADLDNAISMLEEAVKVTPDRHFDKPWMVTSLGNALRLRFVQRSDVADLHRAISMIEDAVRAIPNGHFNQPWILASLGEAFRVRFVRCGDIAGLEIAISMTKDAVEVISDDHFDKFWMFASLGDVLRGRFARRGLADDLDNAILMLEKALERIPDRYFDRASVLASFGDALRVRFVRRGVVADLDKAISLIENAVKLTPDDHFDKAWMLASLGDALRVRFVKYGAIADLDNAISMIRDAIELTPLEGGHFDKPWMLASTGHALSIRFIQHGVVADLNNAVSMIQEAIEQTPSDHLDKPWMFAFLGDALRLRFMAGLEDGARLAPESSRSNKGPTFHTRVVPRRDDITDLDNAISMVRDAVERTPDGHFDKIWTLASLGEALRIRSLQRDGTLESVRNIVIVGETGVGKSSLINLITGLGSALTANDVRGVTIGTECHDWVFDNQTYRLWDTPGLSEGSFGSVSSKQAKDALRSLLTELGREGGVHLMVLCMRGLPRITKGMKQTYETIAKIRDKTAPDVPLVAVVTDLEKRSVMASTDTIISSMDEWWSDNFQTLSELNMQFYSHACITTLTDDCYPKLPGRRDLCQAIVRRLIIQGVSVRLARNIVVVGEIGVGKSSLINLVLGSDLAVTANDFSPVTTSEDYYDLEIDDQAIRLWDTPGLGDGLHGSGSQKHAQEALRSLFADLNEGGGVHLLIICIRGSSKAMAPFLKMREKFCPVTPVVAIITGLEGLSTPVNPTFSMEVLWFIRSGTFADGETFSGHACITTLPDSCDPQVPGRRVACQNLVRRLIIDHSLRPQTAPLKDLHVLLFGDTGVGKSSVINLLAGWQIASKSPDSAPCTLDSFEYQFQLGSTTIRLWDTVGLEVPEKTNGYVGAIEKAVSLIRRLNKTGGISLFLFCISGHRITATTQSIYRFFYEIFGKKEVPVALVVTHLEREERMEDWWTRNSKTLEKSGIRSDGHACITSLEGHPKCNESRDVLQRLLSRFDDQGKFSMPSEAWIGRTLKGLGSFVEKGFPRRKDLIRILTKRCNLDPEVALRVAACIDSDGS